MAFLVQIKLYVWGCDYSNAPFWFSDRISCTYNTTGNIHKHLIKIFEVIELSLCNNFNVQLLVQHSLFFPLLRGLSKVRPVYISNNNFLLLIITATTSIFDGDIELNRASLHSMCEAK